MFIWRVLPSYRFRSLANLNAMPSWRTISLSTEWNGLKNWLSSWNVSMFCWRNMVTSAGTLFWFLALYLISSRSANALSVDALVNPCNLIFSFNFWVDWKYSNCYFESSTPRYAIVSFMHVLPNRMARRTHAYGPRFLILDSSSFWAVLAII